MSDTARAALWMIGAIASFTAMAIAGRAVSFDHDTFEIMLYRSIVGIVVVLAVATLSGTRKDIRARYLGLHTLRNISHFTGQNLWFYAITMVPLAQVFALEFTLPLWVLLLSPIFLGERITRPQAWAALIGFVGVLIVTRPFSATLSLGVIAAAAAAIGFAGSAVSTRKLTRTESVVSILFWLTAMQTLFGLIMAGYDGDIALPGLAALPWLVLIGIAGLLAHFCLTSALSLAPASVVMPVDFTRLPIIAVVGWAFYDEAFDPYVLAGGALIIAGNWINLALAARGARAG
ncbi:DMT family transporter [Sinisalibacter aestuarii]|uniref:DMT transporter permease n=1 Tax=Sinisalibacter aestuarii TaxID=2949426 RepID=A0ABQ5LRR4_9RHOB|nr:DMT family transporter [Sinisalibacter aestuarii]GKY87653.1 DMT transporter permease [Sinisalibacter aestuarii]